MPTPDNDPDQEKKRQELEPDIWRRVAFASGLFLGDVTVRTLLESLPVGCIILDGSGTILLVNNRTEQMFGYAKEELMGKPHAVFLPERFRTVHEEHMARFFAEPAAITMPHSLDVTALRRDESEFPVSIDLGSIETVNGVHFLAFVSDITIRKQFERRLRESEELFHLQTEQVRDYAIFTIDPQGIVLNWNAGAERLKGYRAEEIIGRHFSCFYSEEARNAGKPEANIKKAADEGQVADEGWRIRKDGSRFWAEVIITALHDENGNLLGFSKVTHDITERKQAENESERDRILLEEAEKLAKVGGWEWDLVENQFHLSGEWRLIHESDDPNFSMETLLLIAHPDDRDAITHAFNESIEKGIPYDIVHRIVRPSDGEVRIIQAYGQLAKDKDTFGKPTRMYGAAQDITERKRSEEALHRLNRELRAISNCNQVMVRAQDEQTMINDICRIICDEAGYRMAWVGYAEKDDARTIRPVAWAGVEEGYLENINITRADTELGHGPGGTAIRSGESACVQDLTTDPKVAPWRESALQRGYRSSIALPLKDENANTFGILNIYSTEPNTFTTDEIRLLEELSGDLAFGISAHRARIERKQTEEALYEAQQVFRILVESSPDIITRFDHDCRRTYVNPTYLKTAQIPQQELLGTTPIERSPLPAASAEILQNLLRRVLDSGLAETIDVIWPKADNIDYWYNISGFPEFDCEGRVASVMTVSRDITERKQMEQEVARLASFPMLSPHPIVELDLNGRITFVNPTAERLFPDLKQQGLSHPYLEDWELLSSSLRCGTKPNDRMVAVGGRWYEQTMHYMPEQLLRIYGFDITERKLAEEALRESEQKYRQLNETLEERIKEAVDELREKNRMLIIQGRQAVMGEMIGNIAHQWRQPLNTLGLLAQELQMVYKRGESSTEYIDANTKRTMEMIQQMSKTIDDFRNFFQIDKVMAKFNVHEMIEKTMSLLEAGLKACGIRIEIAATDDISINGYSNEFAQVLLNLVNNAKDALLERNADKPAITIRSWIEGGKVVVTVSDNAGGIPEGIMDKVFEPYFTTKGPDKGTGIGLYMSKTIIEEHMNGRLSVRNAGDGAEFRIEI